MSELVAQFREWREAIRRSLPPWAGRAAAVTLIIAGALLPLFFSAANNFVNKEVVVLGMKDIEVEAGMVVPPVQMRRVHKWEDDAIAGGVDDHIHLLAGAVNEEDAVALIFLHVGLGEDVALADIVRHLRIDDGMRLEELVVRPGDAETREVADSQAVDELAD